MYAMDADEWGGASVDGLYVWKYDVDWTNSNNTTWTGPVNLNPASFGMATGRVPQLGTTSTLDTLAGRLMYSAIYRNFGTHESVYITHLADVGGVRAQRWYEVRISSGNSSIYQQGTYQPDNNHRFMGSIAADKNGGIALGYSVTSSAMYPAIRYAGRLAGDPLGQLSQGENTLIAGGGSQTAYNRWGDYSTMTIDPSDDETFWYTQEYYSSSGTNWKTRIGSFKISGDPVVTHTIAEGVDYDTLSFTKTGDAYWSYDTATYFNDNDSAKSGTITHSQSCSIETSVTVASAKAVKFYWKVSSESGYDYLRFYIDGVVQDSIAGTVDWTQKSFNIAAGTHTLKWTYSKDGSVSSGSDCGWVDKLEVGDGTVVTNNIGDAMDLPTQNFTLSGNGDWAVDNSIAYYDGDSIKSPAITHNQSASVETAISGVTQVKFYWKVSSETSYDYLRFYIDGALQDSIAGTVDWTQKTYSVTSGSHTLKWTYSKDGSVSSGSDCGWVDKLELTTGTSTDPLGEAR